MLRTSVVVALIAIPSLILSLALTQTSPGSGLDLGEHASLGPHLVDAEGRSLYVYLKDDEGVSNCDANCIRSYPPLPGVREGAMAAVGDGVDQDLVGAIERPDGSLQLTYAGRPLYLFSRDVPGMAAGQGAGGVWYLVSPQGQPLGAPEETAEAAGGSVVDPMVLGEFMGEGREVYGQYCAGCHGAEGQGGEGVALAGNDNLADGRHVIRQILRGSRFMPRWADVLSDREVAVVSTFVRNAWRNEFGLVMEEEVRTQR